MCLEGYMYLKIAKCIPQNLYATTMRKNNDVLTGMEIMKKPKYVDEKAKNKFLIIADYQPSCMYSMAEDRKESRHETTESAYEKIEEHKKNGASVIEVLESIVRVHRTK